jgi:hypothetical protein
MKNLLLILWVLVAGVGTSTAQTATLPAKEQELLDKSAKSTCTCMDKLIASTPNLKYDQASLTTVLTKCLVKEMPAMASLLKARGQEINDANSEAFGQELVLRMLELDCASMAKFVETVAQNTMDESEQSTEVSGIVLAAECNQFCTIRVKQSNGKIITLSIISNFEGGDEIISNITALVGQNISTSSTTMEVYDAAARGFAVRNVVNSAILIGDLPK